MGDVAAVRKRPGMYVGGLGESGVLHLVLEALSNAFDQHLAGRCSRIHLAIAANGTIEITDNGPGIPSSSLTEWLETLSTNPTVDGHRPHAHLGAFGVGLFVVNALSERLEVKTVRDRIEATTTYARGAVVEALRTAPTNLASGTTVRFRPDPTVFPHPRAPRAELTRVLEDLSFLAPQLALSWSYTGDDLTRAGLVGHVGLRAECGLDAVASHRELYATAEGPVDVDVAIVVRTPHPAWVTPFAIYSFVNFARTIEDGTHVQGLLDGVSAFLGGRRREADTDLVVATVSVILADVIYGNPTRDRLDSPQAREPVARATKTALDIWASTHAAEADALRAYRTEH